MELKTKIEALLFASDQPLGTARLCEVLSEAKREEIQAALAELEASYQAPEHALRVLRVAGGYQLATKPEFSDTVRRLFIGKRRVRLTKAALESLAIIAYKQPTTRPEIDAIRGVASGGVLETLLERSLVRIAGRSEGVGRPLFYATTPEFLQYLGLDRLADLPSLEELEQMLAERESAARLADEEEMQEMMSAARASERPSMESEVEASPADQAEGKASAAARLAETDFASLEQLDEELREQGERVRELSARLAADRKQHAGEVPEAVPDVPQRAPAEPAGAVLEAQATPGAEPEDWRDDAHETGPGSP